MPGGSRIAESRGNQRLALLIGMTGVARPVDDEGDAIPSGRRPFLAAREKLIAAVGGNVAGGDFGGRVAFGGIGMKPNSG